VHVNPALAGESLAGLALVAGALGLHPFTTYPLRLRVLAALRTRPVLAGKAPESVAICVCAYNEQDVIAQRVENMLAMRRKLPALDILIYVDAASDDTVRVLQPYADRIKLVVSTERLGKTAGMNRLVAMTQAEVLVFSDANVSFAEDALPNLLAPFGDPGIGCVCGHLLYLEAGAATSTAATGSLYWRLEEHIKALESETGSVMGADGSIFAIRRTMHVPPPVHLIDDMFVSLSVLCAGGRIVRAAGAIAYEAAVSRPAEEFRRKIRIACQAFNVNKALWPKLVRLPALDLYKYVSHKLLRWLSIFLFGLSAVFAFAALFLLADPVIASCALAAACASGVAACLSRNGPLAKLREVVTALAATGIGVLRAVRGETFQTWNPPASARAAIAPTAHEPARA